MRQVFIFMTLWLTVSASASFTNQYETLTTLTGDSYSNAKVKRREKDVIVVFHAAGIERIPIADLPAEIRSEIGLPTDIQLKELKQQERRFEDAQRQRGLVKHQGRWVTIEDRAKLNSQAEVKMDRRAILKQLRSAPRVAVKDLKNFPDKYVGKVVRVDCMVSSFERDERQGCFSMDMEGVQVRSPSTMDVLSGSDPHNIVRGDGIYLFGFARIAFASEKTALYCNEKMDGRHAYYANVFMLIAEDGPNDHYGSCITIQFKSNMGKVYHTTPVESF